MMDLSWIKKTDKPRIVTHRDTDGVVSAALIYAVLGDLSPEIVTTNYNEIDAPLNSKKKFLFEKNDIVVDLPQPDIDVVFWSDHHQSGMRYQKPKYPYLYDKKAKSCAGPLYRRLVRKFKFLKRFADLVKATDMIDSVGYPDAKSHKNIDNYGNKIRLGLDVGSAVHDNVFYKPALIKALATAKDWRTVLDNPLHMARVHTSLFRYKEYEQKAIKYMALRDGVVYSDIGKRYLPGLLNRYYAFEAFPQAHYSLSVYIVRGLHRIVLSINPFNKNALPDRLNLGEIAKSINSKGGGHKGIGVIPGIDDKHKEEVINHLLDLLNKGKQ